MVRRGQKGIGPTCDVLPLFDPQADDHAAVRPEAALHSLRPWSRLAIQRGPDGLQVRGKIAWLSGGREVHNARPKTLPDHEGPPALDAYATLWRGA